MATPAIAVARGKILGGIDSGGIVAQQLLHLAQAFEEARPVERG
jgi:hypothetical protein